MRTVAVAGVASVSRAVSTTEVTSGARSTSAQPAARARRVEQLLEQAGVGEVGEGGVVAVHGLRPRGHRAPHRRLDDVGVEAGVGDGEVAGLGHGAARVVVIDLRGVHARGQGVGTAASTRTRSVSRASSAGSASRGASSWCAPSSSCSIDSSVQRRRRACRGSSTRADGSRRRCCRRGGSAPRRGRPRNRRAGRRPAPRRGRPVAGPVGDAHVLDLARSAPSRGCASPWRRSPRGAGATRPSGRAPTIAARASRSSRSQASWIAREQLGRLARGRARRRRPGRRRPRSPRCPRPPGRGRAAARR